MKRNTKSSFWEYVDIPEGLSDACWLWNGAQRGDGYGAFKINNQQHGAHRYSYQLTYGAIAPGLCVLHRCDTPLCVRPDHLFLGTNKVNVADRVAKGRSGRTPGEQHWTKKYPEHPWLVDRKNYRQRGEE